MCNSVEISFGPLSALVADTIETELTRGGQNVEFDFVKIKTNSKPLPILT